MGHSIRAFIGPASAMRRAAAAFGPATLIALTSELGLVGATDDLLDQLDVGSGGPPVPPFSHLTRAALDRWLAAVADGPCGYIETDYFGGAGDQRAGAWSGAQVLVEPRSGPGSVNEVLAALGVVRRAGDEWDAVGMTRFRRMDRLRSLRR